MQQPVAIKQVAKNALNVKRMNYSLGMVRLGQDER